MTMELIERGSFCMLSKQKSKRLSLGIVWTQGDLEQLSQEGGSEEAGGGARPKAAPPSVASDGQEEPGH
jgi:hypothetical protein